MEENGGIVTSTNNKNKTNTSFHMDEPPPDPNDFGTKEEEIKNRELLEHLYEQQKKRREILDRLTREEEVKKELEEEQRIRKLVSQKAYYERRNASAKYRSMAYNERIKKMLDKVDEYMRKITNLESIAKIKDQAQKEFEEENLKNRRKKRKVNKDEIEKLAQLNEKNKRLRIDNIKKIEERKKNEILKAEKLKKAEEANKRAEKILKNGYKLPKGGDENNEDKNVNIRSGGLGIFQEEETGVGTNLSPNMMPSDNKSNLRVNNKRPNSSYKMTKNNLYKTNNKEEINPEEKLKQILKKDPNNVKELLKFQKKYKYIEIGPYIHKAKMYQIRQSKNKPKNKKHIPNKIQNNNTNENNEENKLMFEEEEVINGDECVNMGEEENENEEENVEEKKEEKKDEKKKNKSKSKSKSKGKKKKKKITKKKKDINNNYLEACKYNNDDCIKSILLNTKDDEEVYKIVNEKDEYGRNGLMYLLIHNNTNMIKLTLLSGVILDDSKDIYQRNLVHYCCTNIVDKSMLDIICHCIDFKRFGELCNYVNKCIPITKRETEDIFSKEFQNECEERIKNFDNLIVTKENGQKEKININNNRNSDEKVNISKMVNSPDIDGNYPIHYLAKDDNLDKMEVLIYYHANLDVLDREGNKPIKLTSNKVIQQYLLKNEQNYKSKNNKNNNVKNGLINGGEQLNKSTLSINVNINSLDIDTVKYYSPGKINSFYVGVENNSYLILSVLQQKYDLFKFLITEKNAKVDYVNGNGWTILFFIVTKKLWNYFAFLLDLTDCDQCDSPEKIYEGLGLKEYEKNHLIQSNGDLTYIGQAIKSLDNLSNNNENILSICINEYDDIFILKSFILLYEIYIKFFAMNEPKNIVFQRQYGKYDESSYLNIIFNRQYGRNKETILIKYVKKKDLETLKYLLDELCRKKKKLNKDIYKGDWNNQNILHHAVLLKQKKIIKYLVKYDSDNNSLKTNKDSKGKTPTDLDRAKAYEYEYITVWDEEKKNDINTLKKIIEELKYYEVNEQTYINKNTPLHYAVKYKADRAILYLIKNGGDKEKVNINGQTPLDVIEQVQFPDKKWVKFTKKLLDGKITEFTELDKIEVDKYMESNNSVKINKKKEKNQNNNKEFTLDMKLIGLLSDIKEKISKKDIDIKELFKKLDKNNNGKLSLKEFKKLFTMIEIEDIEEKDINYILLSFDTNNDGKLQYKEFLNLMT